MKFRATFLSLSLALGAGLTLAGEAEAKKKYENLKVLEDNGKQLKKGMKLFTKGLGVKCKACHVKGDYASDEVKAKLEGRKFLEAVFAAKDDKAKDDALATLVAALGEKEARAPDRVWKGVGMFVKKK